MIYLPATNASKILWMTILCGRTRVDSYQRATTILCGVCLAYQDRRTTNGRGD
jgi:hypothetical protein